MAEIMDEGMVKKIAEIARLHLHEDEVKKMSEELDRILKHFLVVEEIKGDRVGESNYHYDMKNKMRKDVESKTDDKTVEAIRKEFTKSDQKYLTAPKSIK